jgi:ATP phosphoribosyltransferase
VATGETLRAHHLRVVEELLVSTARLVVNRVSWKTQFEFMRRLQRELSAVQEGEDS